MDLNPLDDKQQKGQLLPGRDQFVQWVSEVGQKGTLRGAWTAGQQSLLRELGKVQVQSAAPDGPSELEQVITCLGDDAAKLHDEWPEVAENMRAAVRLLEAGAAQCAAPDERAELARQIVQDTNDTLRDQSAAMRALKAENDQLRASLAAQPAKAEAGICRHDYTVRQPAYDSYAAKRLRLVAEKLGLGDAIPKDNFTLWQCAFAVLGRIRFAVEKLQQPATAQPVAAQGIIQAAEFIEKRAEEYLQEHADYEPETGALAFEFGEAGREYHSGLVELAEEIRTLAAPSPEGQP